MRVWKSVDRWGPGFVALTSFLALIFYAWMNDQRMAKLEGMVQARLQMESSLRMEIQTFQAYIVKLERTVTEHGIKLPEKEER